MRIQCAWCEKHLGEKEPLCNPAVTDSICPECAKRVKGKQVAKVCIGCGSKYEGAYCRTCKSVDEAIQY